MGRALRFGLAARIAVVATAATLLAIGATIAVSARTFHREYTAALDSRALAIATGLEVQLQRVLGLGLELESLVGFDEQCREAVVAFGGIDHAMVVGLDGALLFRSDFEDADGAVQDPRLLAAVRSGAAQVATWVEDGRERRGAIVPVLDPAGAPRAGVVVEFPPELVTAKALRMVAWNVGAGLLCLAGGLALLAATLSTLVTRPLARLVETLQDLRRRPSDPSCRAAARVGGDVARLAQAFDDLLDDLRATTVSKSELERALDVLREAEARHRRVLEAAPTAMFVECADGLWFVNPAGVELLGAADDADVCGRTLLDFVRPESRARVAEAVRSLLEGGPPIQERDVKLSRLDGAPLDVELTGIAFSWDGAPAAQLVVQDVTERKAMQAQLVAAGRLASLGTLARGVAHEINNPLAYVISGLQFVGDELAGAGALSGDRLAEARAAVDDAQRGACQVRDIVRDLQAFSRERDRVDAVELPRVLDLAAKIASSQLRFRARLVKEYASVPRVLADETRLGQVFLNLLVNAAQAIPEGRPDLHEIRVVLRQEGAAVVVEVRDTGAGIPPEVRERIFDPFFTTKQVGTGTGLGLFISHGLVRGMGGEIGFETELGRGTTFRVTLPAAAFADVPLPPAETTSAAA